jgi:hypothetical protein
VSLSFGMTFQVRRTRTLRLRRAQPRVDISCAHRSADHAGMKAKRGEVWRGFILFLLEPWIAGSEASGMIDARAREFGISRLLLLKAPQFPVLSICVGSRL